MRTCSSSKTGKDEDCEEDYQRAIRIHEFERKNRIKFVQGGGDITDFSFIQVRRKK